MTILADLTQVLEDRKKDNADDSYVASLYAGGINKILEKIGEEATEVVIAGKDAAANASDEAQQEVIKEVADLWFHCMVLLAAQGLSAEDVLNELGERFGISGHDEKAARDQ
jgi:phosphoribosyl-ATP pyrophosphohydrolase